MKRWPAVAWLGIYTESRPGIGFDRATPLGDTTEHSDAIGEADPALRCARTRAAR